MITLNGRQVEIGSFPDGTILMRHNCTPIFVADEANIVWKYENDREFLALAYLVKHLRCHGIGWIQLYMPYIPNARMDRVKNNEDVFTLKYFAELLNSLEFDAVMVLDAHSSVSEALINNCCPKTPVNYINMAIDKICSSNLLMFYPDGGAARRYSDLIKKPYAYGLKNRDWDTGKILGLDVVDNGFSIKHHDILIVDDICSRGGTFLHAAKRLKELGAKDIYLYISHCENTILEGELLTSGLIKKVYTTDSIFTKEHELIEVLK